MAQIDLNRRKSLKGVLIGLVGFIALFSIGSMVFVKNFYDGYFTRTEQPKYSGYLKYGDVPEYDRTVVQFKSGENNLTGYLFGQKNDKGLVVIAHGLGYGAEDYLAEALYFVDQGWRVFSYDGTGTYESEGESRVGLPQSLLDLDAALGYVASDPGLSGLPVVLYGHSWGGYAVTAILNEDAHQIRAAASLAGFNAPGGLIAEEMGRMVGPLSFIEVPFARAYQSIKFGSTARMTAVDGINHSGIPVMIVHGTADESVFYDGASIISHQGEITNPNVVYKTCSAENHNGHNTLAESQAAGKYIKELNQTYQTLIDRYGGNLPDEERAKFYAGVDPFRTSELNTDFMDEINRFFEAALSD